MARRWLILIAMTGSFSMVMLDQTVVTVALPSIGRELGMSAPAQQWVVNAYVLALAALVAVGGKLGDRLGGTTVFRIGVITFFVASAACGLAPANDWGPAWLIVARVVQGAGAALMMPVSAAIVINAFSPAERGRAMAVYAGISQIFLAVGPLVGGVLTQLLSWRAVFWLNVPVGLVALVLVHLAVPDNVADPTAEIRPGPVVLLVVGIGTLLLGLQQTTVWGWVSPATLLCLAFGVITTTTFVTTQLRSRRPLVALRLFSGRAFAGPVLVLGLVQFGLLPLIVFSSLYLQDLLGFTPVITGLAVLPFILPLTVAAQIGGRWYDRSGGRPPAITGLLTAAVGLAAWTASLPSIDYALQIPGMMLTGFGLGLVSSATNTEALGRVAGNERSQASGLVQTVRQFGGAVGVAVLSAVVLGLEPQGSRADARTAADAITIGFAAATAVFALALAVAAVLLDKQRIDAASELPLEPAV